MHPKITRRSDKTATSTVVTHRLLLITSRDVILAMHKQMISESSTMATIQKMVIDLR